MKKCFPQNAVCLLSVLICLLVSGCGNSSKEQIIVVYDYSESTEKEYDYTNESLDNLVNQISDFFLDNEKKTDEIPNEALKYRNISVFQSDKKKTSEQQKSNENRIINFEIYQHNNELYCEATFSFTDEEYSAKLSAEISEQVKKLETAE